MSPDSHWSGTLAMPTSLGDCREPAVTAAGEVVHVVWTHGRALNHLYLSEGTWSQVQQFAVGGQAALAVAPDGCIHCLFSAQILHNVEIYHTSWNDAAWGLPELVSRTSGISTYPALAIGADGTLHAVWADTTPGASVIYYGQRDGAGWRSRPIPNGSGSHPTIAVGPDGEIYVAWQSRLAETDRFEIFSTIGRGGIWDLPSNVSDNRQQHSIHPRLAITAQGICHLVWQEERGGNFCTRHADRYPNGWSETCDLTQSRRRLSVAASLHQPPGLPAGGLGRRTGCGPPNPSAGAERRLVASGGHL